MRRPRTVISIIFPQRMVDEYTWKGQAMKRFFLLVVLFVMVVSVGCRERAVPFGFGDGQVDTHAQRARRYANITEYEARGLVDDIDTFWLADRPTYMSYWHLREAD